MKKNILFTLFFSTVSILLADEPDWQDDPGCCEFTAWIVGGIVQSDGVNIAEDGDMFAAFNSAGDVRGVAVQLNPPFGPYQGEIVYEMTMRSHAAGEVLTFQYYDASEDAILNIAETYTFVINEQLGDMFEPVSYNVAIAENYPDWQQSHRNFLEVFLIDYY